MHSIMRILVRSVIVGALGSAACLLVSAANLKAQDRPPQGNFDPAQMRQRMLERMREPFDVKDDAEWKAIAERIEKIMQARRNLGPGGGPGGFGFPGGPGGPGGQGSASGPQSQRSAGGLPGQAGPGGPDGFGPPDGAPPPSPDAAQGPPSDAGGLASAPPAVRAVRAGFRREASPELDALRKALDNKASAAETKAKLADLRAARKQKEAELEKAQDNLRAILSVRQEAVAVTLGLLK
jgi:hypothetical protein